MSDPTNITQNSIYGDAKDWYAAIEDKETVKLLQVHSFLYGVGTQDKK